MQPNYSNIASRKDADCCPTFLGFKFNSVAIPANMKCTIDFSKAVELDEFGYFYILHRFYDYKLILDWINYNQDLNVISISVGTQEKDHEFIRELQRSQLRVDIITIDVAHGYHVSVRDMIAQIKVRNLRGNPKIIAGNIGTPEAALALKSWGADAVKVGLSMGKSCTTYNCTGVGTPMFSAVRDICFKETPFKDNVFRKDMPPVIADGQVREVGDVCKALVAGASMVMIGSEFAKCADSPAEVFDNRKVFYGSASAFNKNSDDYIEGQKVMLDQRTESYLGFLKRINQGVQSCMSYAGTDRLEGLREMIYNIHY